MEIRELICNSDNINLKNIKQNICDAEKLEINSFRGDKSMILATYRRRLESITNLSEQLELQDSIQLFIADLEKSTTSELTCHLVDANHNSCMLITDKANEIIIAALDWTNKK
jgi:hypothetical protein